MPVGRWSLLRAQVQSASRGDEAIEGTARRLLARYGVLLREVCARERRLPPWRKLLYALRRLEARGEVRGGRFVEGFIGEQFALPEAVRMLRGERGRQAAGAELRVSAADPLNLAGVLTPGARVPAGHSRHVVLRDGVPVAAIERGRRSELPATETGWVRSAR